MRSRHSSPPSTSRSQCRFRARAISVRLSGVNPIENACTSAGSASGSASKVSAKRPKRDVEVGALGRLVHHVEPRRDAGGDAMLDQDALREGVQGADGRLVDLLAGRLEAGLIGVLRGDFLDLLPHTLAQLGRGGLGEGDRRDLAQ